MDNDLLQPQAVIEESEPSQTDTLTVVNEYVKVPDWLFRKPHPSIIWDCPNGHKYKAYLAKCPICDSPFYSSAWDLIYKKNRNVILIVIGNPGTGKSYIALRIAEALDPTFSHITLRDRLVTTPREFLSLPDRHDLNKGYSIIFDEAGAGMSAREWAKIDNKAMTKYLQTFRYRNLITIFTVPFLSFTDVNVRKLVSYIIETKEIDDNNRNVVKFYHIARTRATAVKKYGDTFLMYPRWSIKGRRVRFDSVYKFKRAEIKICHEYERLAEQLKNKIRLRELGKLEDHGRKKEVIKYDARGKARELFDSGKWKKYKQKWAGKITVSAIAIRSDYDLKHTQAKEVKFYLEEILREKGYRE